MTTAHDDREAADNPWVSAGQASAQSVASPDPHTTEPAQVADPILTGWAWFAYNVRHIWYVIRDSDAWQSGLMMPPPKYEPLPYGRRRKLPEVPIWEQKRAKASTREKFRKQAEERGEVATAPDQETAGAPNSTRQPTVDTYESTAELERAESSSDVIRFPDRGDVAPWQGAEPLRWRTNFAYRFIRGLIILVLCLAAFTGIRQWFRPTQTNQHASTQVPATVQFPAATAGGVAARFAGAYLSWDERAPDDRAEALAGAGWTGQQSVGWDGKGKQSVSSITVANVQPSSATTGSVTVSAKITTWKGSGDTWAADSDRWVGLLVPVAVNPAGASVTGSPSLVPVPQGPSVDPDQGLAITDQDLITSTTDMAKTFFSSYASSNDVSGLTAPGSKINGLAGAVKLDRVDSWTVAPPTGDRAKAQAAVVWATPDGATITQTYHLILQRTVAGTATRWQVSQIV